MTTCSPQRLPITVIEHNCWKLHTTNHRQNSQGTFFCDSNSACVNVSQNCPILSGFTGFFVIRKCWPAQSAWWNWRFLRGAAVCSSNCGSVAELVQSLQLLRNRICPGSQCILNSILHFEPERVLGEIHLQTIRMTYCWTKFDKSSDMTNFDAKLFSCVACPHPCKDISTGEGSPQRGKQDALNGQQPRKCPSAPEVS